MKIECLHAGQDGPYSDMRYHIKVYLEENENPTIDEVLKVCDNGSRLPKSEWSWKTPEIYFRGWYTLYKTDYGYEYYGYNPYDD
jgi:hypothetical protein